MSKILNGLTKKRRSTLAAASAGLALLLGGATLATAASGDGAGTAAATGTSLRDVLAKKRAALARPEAQTPLIIEAHITAESRSGVRRLRIGDFQSLSDSDRSYAGYDLGPGSWDTFAAVLASAIADEFVVQAATRNIPVDAIDIIFTSRPDTPEIARTRKVSYPRNLAYTAYIDSPASDAQLDELRRAVDAISPVLSLVRESQPLGHGAITLTPSSVNRDPDLPPGLRDFLVEKRAAILRRSQKPATPRANPPQPTGLRAHAHVEPSTGIRNTRTGEKNFQIIHDSRPSHLGYGLAPSADEHIIGVLGTCLTHIFEIEAAKKQSILDGLELRTHATLTPRTSNAVPRYRNISYSIAIESPAPAKEIEELRGAVESSCPIYNLLKDSQEIDSRVVHERYKG